VLTGHGGLDKLEYHQNWPKPASGEVLVRVGACGLNNSDADLPDCMPQTRPCPETTADFDYNGDPLAVYT